MKRLILAKRLPHLLLGGLITGLIVASAVVLPATPAHATNQYLYDFYISGDLSFHGHSYVGEKSDLSKKYETTDSKKICEKLKQENTNFYKDNVEKVKKEAGISHRQVDNCEFQDSHFFIDYSGKHDEKLLKRATSEYALKIKNENELVVKNNVLSQEWERELSKIDKRQNIGMQRITFPGKILKVTPQVGKVSGNTWTQDKPLTATEREKVEQSNESITFTAERYGSKLGLILGITIPAALIIVAVIVLLIVRSSRKKKQQSLPPYPAGYGSYPPPPFMPGNSPYPTQSQVPGYPAAPGAPNIPGPYPPSVPPQPAAGQPGAPTPGGYYPYPYPYPPANPQGSQTGYPLPSQSYGAPTPGFQPPAAPPQPAAGQPGNPDDSNQATESHKPKHVAKPEQSTQTD